MLPGEHPADARRVLTLRELIDEAVRDELRLRSQLRRPKLALACIGVGYELQNVELDPDEAVRRALAAFEEQNYEVWIDGTRISSLDQTVEVGLTSDLVFLPTPEVRSL